MESVTRRITSARLDASTVLVLLVQFACDAWALECRVCDCCANMFSVRDAVQVMAAADQVDEQLIACASAFKMRLEEECRQGCREFCYRICLDLFLQTAVAQTSSSSSTHIQSGIHCSCCV